MKALIITILAICFLQIVAAVDYSEVVPEEQKVDAQLEVLKQIKEGNLTSCIITYGYNWRNLDLFGRVEPTVKIEKLPSGDEYSVSFYRHLSQRAPNNKRNVSEPEYTEYFLEMIRYAEFACHEAKQQNAKAIDRWIRIQAKSADNKKLNFLIAYWGDNEAFSKFKEHVEEWSEPVERVND